ncbi:MAG TPA: GNAT family N-acetyltransferase [Pyrinomonadaceae bacterium]|nr:GNAT family N-acetyltransferase [Pyrinomonadaceae bacterium]
METNLECGGGIIAPSCRNFPIRCGIIGCVITCRKMGAADVRDAFHMLSDFLSEDEHYLASSQAYGDLGLAGLNNALDIFLEQPQLGFVWMAYDEDGVAGICVVCYAISTSMGAVVAKLDDVSVKADRRGKRIGSEMIEQLKEQLRREAVTRIDVAVHLENPEARRFYEKGGFVALNEERLSCII